MARFFGGILIAVLVILAIGVIFTHFGGYFATGIGVLITIALYALGIVAALFALFMFLCLFAFAIGYTVDPETRRLIARNTNQSETEAPRRKKSETISIDLD